MRIFTPIDENLKKWLTVNTVWDIIEFLLNVIYMSLNKIKMILNREIAMIKINFHINFIFWSMVIYISIAFEKIVYCQRYCIFNVGIKNLGVHIY